METFKVDLKQIIIFEIKISLQLCNMSFFQHGREAEKKSYFSWNYSAFPSWLENREFNVKEHAVWLSGRWNDLKSLQK